MPRSACPFLNKFKKFVHYSLFGELRSRQWKPPNVINRLMWPIGQRSTYTFLKLDKCEVELDIDIIRKMWSFSFGPKAITISSFHCSCFLMVGLDCFLQHSEVGTCLNCFCGSFFFSIADFFFLGQSIL